MDKKTIVLCNGTVEIRYDKDLVVDLRTLDMGTKCQIVLNLEKKK